MSMDHNIDRVKGPWSPEEDEILRRLVLRFGARNWALISKSIAGRSGKSCRLRWCNQLSPEVEHRPFTLEEDETIVHAHAQFGNKWATIARFLNGRTDNAVKNHWNSTLKRQLKLKEKDYLEETNAKPTKHPKTTNNISPAASSSSNVSELELTIGDDQEVYGVSTKLTVGLACNSNNLFKENELSDEDHEIVPNMIDLMVKPDFMEKIQETIRKEVRECMAEFGFSTEGAKNDRV